MRLFISKEKKWLGYILYCVMLTLGLLYYRFPSDALRDYLQIRANSLDTPISVSIGRIKPWPSLGLKLGQTELSIKGQSNRKLFRADSLIIRPSIWSFLQGKFKFCFNCHAYDGVLKGCAHFIENSIKAPFTASIEFKDIRIGDYGNLQGLISSHVKGDLGGTITYSGKYNSLINGAGEADLRISKGQVELLWPILNFKPIDFNELWIKIILKKQKINLTKLELKGRDIHGTLSGIVSLKKEFFKSSLDLKGTLEPFTDFFKGLMGTRGTIEFNRQRIKKGRLSFIIHGTLEEPIIKFI